MSGKYYRFRKEQKKALPLELCYFEKVLVAEQHRLPQQDLQLRKLKAVSFYKKIAFYSYICLFLFQ